MKKEIVFVMPGTLTKNDPIGIWRLAFEAYKEYQTRRQWELMTLTQDVYKAFGKKLKEETSIEGGGAEGEMDEDDEIAAEEQEVAEKSVSNATLQSLVERLSSLRHLDIVYRSKEVMEAVDELTAKPDAKLLWRCFTRGFNKQSGKYGLNLAMTPKRVNQQALRFMGSTILDATYYSWLHWMKRPLPLKEDEIYTKRWRAVTGRAGEVPTDYDPRVVLKYYQMKVEELRLTVKVPEDVELRLLPPSERKARLAEAEQVAL